MSKIAEKKDYIKPGIGFVVCRSTWFVMNNSEGSPSEELSSPPDAKATGWDDGTPVWQDLDDFDW